MIMIICILVYTHISLSIYLYLYLSLSLSLYIYIYIYIRVCISLSLYIYIYIYIICSRAQGGRRRPPDTMDVFGLAARDVLQLRYVPRVIEYGCDTVPCFAELRFVLLGRRSHK